MLLAPSSARTNPRGAHSGAEVDGAANERSADVLAWTLGYQSERHSASVTRQRPSLVSDYETSRFGRKPTEMEIDQRRCVQFLPQRAVGNSEPIHLSEKSL